MAEGNKCNIIVLFLHQIVLRFCKINNQRLIYRYPESSSIILIFKRAALTRKIAFCCIPKMFCKLQCNIFKTKRIFIVCTPLGDGGEAGGRGWLSHFSEDFIQEGLRSNWDFGWELVLYVGVIFFRWDLKTPFMKNSDYESQTEK